MEELKRLGKLIKIWRNMNSMTQDQLASKLGLSRATIGYWESGEKEPTATNFVQLVNILGIPWEEIYQCLGIEKKTMALPGLQERVLKIESVLEKHGMLTLT
jgi:transcriptional regulator with XRE-family HTH domain